VANPNEYYIEDECTYYHEQTTTRPRNEETVEEIFCESSLEDPLGERFDQLGDNLDLDKLLEHVETFNEPNLKDPLVELFDEIGCDLDLDKLLKQAKMFSEPGLEDPLEEYLIGFHS
jgi:hypothetical protein